MRCVACNVVLEPSYLVKPDGSEEDMCPTCLRIVNTAVVELGDFYEEQDNSGN